MNTPSGKKDIFAVLVEFEEQVLQSKPVLARMKEEVRMMDFKIRPVQGDISNLDLTSTKFIEALWCMGKLDELYQHIGDEYSDRDRELFGQFAANLQNTYMRELQHVMVSNSQEDTSAAQIEIEIYRESIAKHGMN